METEVSRNSSSGLESYVGLATEENTSLMMGLVSNYIRHQDRSLAEGGFKLLLTMLDLLKVETEQLNFVAQQTINVLNSSLPSRNPLEIKGLLSDRLEGKSKPTGGGSKEKKSEPSASVELNAGNFDELVIESNELWIVEFFAPWCGHCKKLAPEWKKAAKNLQGKVKLGHVNCDVEQSIMSRFKVQGFPTILVFGPDKSSPYPYEGARSASAIESFASELVESSAGPVEVTELTGPDVMEKKCGSAAICFISFLPDILDSKAEGRNKYLEMLLSVAEKFKKHPYSFMWVAAVTQPDLEKRVNVGGYGYPAMVAMNVKKGVYAPLKSAFELQHLLEFVKDAGTGGKGNVPMNGTPEIVKTKAWDGKDGELIEEDEFSLDELMGGDDAVGPKDEL